MSGCEILLLILFPLFFLTSLSLSLSLSLSFSLSFISPLSYPRSKLTTFALRCIVYRFEGCGWENENDDDTTFSFSFVVRGIINEQKMKKRGRKDCICLQLVNFCQTHVSYYCKERGKRQKERRLTCKCISTQTLRAFFFTPLTLTGKRGRKFLPGTHYYFLKQKYPCASDFD